MNGGNGNKARRPYRRVSPDEMEGIRSFVLEGLKARSLMQCASVFRVVDGERFTVGWTWGQMQLGVDLGQMLTRLKVSAGHQRFIRFLGWVQGDTFKSFDSIERLQLEDDAMMFKGMACDGYRKMFPD